LDIDAGKEKVRGQGRVAVASHHLALNVWIAVRMDTEMDFGLCEAAYCGAWLAGGGSGCLGVVVGFLVTLGLVEQIVRYWLISKALAPMLVRERSSMM
jgi:hypothetical protein